MRSAGSIRDMQMPSGADCAAARRAAQLSPTRRGSLLLSRVTLRARSSAWLEPAAHNGLVAGSNPAGPTFSLLSLLVVVPAGRFLNLSALALARCGRYGPGPLFLVEHNSGRQMCARRGTV